MDNLSILIQGPLNSISLDNLNYYKSLGQVIISYWDTCKHEILSNYDLANVICIRRPLPTFSLKAANHYQTFTPQVTSIYNGLSQVKTDYVIRTRSDELWCNLLPLIEKFNKDKNKIVCGNAFFKKWSKFQFHPGDHLFIGKTHILLNAYKKILEDIYLDKVAESVMAFSVMDALNLAKTKENFIKVFDVINSNELSPFIAQWNQRHITYINKFDDPACIISMDQL